MKTHFAVPGTLGLEPACGRGRRVETNVYRVDCGLCLGNAEYQSARQAADAEREADFWAQTPVEVRNPWTQTNLVCHVCGGTTFRDRGRDLFTFWYMCANPECHKLQGYPTETGMCS